jgi:hypothetical protein
VCPLRFKSGTVCTEALFWTDKWLDGTSLEQLTLVVAAAVDKQSQKARLVAEALHNDQWIRDITVRSGSAPVRTVMVAVTALWFPLPGTQPLIGCIPLDLT